MAWVNQGMQALIPVINRVQVGKHTFKIFSAFSIFRSLSFRQGLAAGVRLDWRLASSLFRPQNA